MTMKMKREDTTGETEIEEKKKYTHTQTHFIEVEMKYIQRISKPKGYLSLNLYRQIPL